MKQLFVRFYILLMASFFLVLSGVMPIVNELVKEENTSVNKDLAKGTFFLLAKECSGLDETGCSAVIEQLQPEFGYPIRVIRLADTLLDQPYQADLVQGNIIRDRESNTHLMRLSGTDLVLQTGPYLLENVTTQTRKAFWVVLTVLLVLPAGIWAFIMHRNLKKIEAATQQFVAGNHSIRLDLPMVLPLRKIAGAFNSMAEKTQNLIDSQKELVNSVSHEIRTPLARIKFSLEMLPTPSATTGSGKDYVGEIKKDVEEIASLVDQILTYARFERQLLPSESLPENEMISWLNQVVSAEQNNYPDRQIRFVPPAGQDQLITAFDPVYLGWAVGNLIRNAVTYGKQIVQVSLEARPGGCTIHVEDDGPGIPESVQEKVFEPFFRQDESRQRESGGYGLGLAIARRIVLWHQGNVQVGTSGFNGARFTVTLPL